MSVAVSYAPWSRGEAGLRRPFGTAADVRALAADEGGAVMLIGLCMACFLIGAMWFVIGIGDAIVFRDTMQEVTDHAAFTSAVLHAKGMNFIAACNLMMLGMVAVHVMMGLINDALTAVALLLAIPSNGGSIEAANAWKEAYKAYGASFKPLASSMHYSEVVSAYGYPQLGYVKSRLVGADYSGFSPRPRVLNVLAVSPSMIGGGPDDASIHGTFVQLGTSGPRFPDDARKGLPVEAHKFSDLCRKVATVGAKSLGEMTGLQGVPGNSQLTDLGGSAIQARYCNDSGGSVPGGVVPAGGGGGDDDENGGSSGGNGGNGGGGGGVAPVSGGSDPGIDRWWGEDGPLYPWKATRNGASWQEIWAFNLRPRYEDAQEHAVGIAQGKLGIVQTAQQPPAYLASAEFYFDCSKKWADPTCNGDDNAAFSIRWRARIRRLNYRLAVGMIRSHAEKFFKSSPEALSVGVPPAVGDPGSLRGVVEDIVSRYGEL